MRNNVAQHTIPRRAEPMITEHSQIYELYDPQPLVCPWQLRVYDRLYDTGHRETHCSCYRIE
jgi:hypothetical protein